MDFLSLKPDARFTVRVPKELLELFDGVAQAQNTNRSKAIIKVMTEEVFKEK